MKKVNIVKFILVFSVFFLFVLPQNTNAYTLIGGKYATGKITYLLQTNHANYTGAAQRGIVAWNNAGTNNVQFTSTTSQTNYNIVFKNAAYGNIGWNGRCANKPVHTSGTYTRSLIDFNSSTMESMTLNQRTGVAAHEIGHALGLDHVTDVNQVMCTWGDGRVVHEPGDDDIAGANYLY